MLRGIGNLLALLVKMFDLSLVVGDLNATVLNLP